MRIIECTQRSAEWFTARCGKVTASDISNVMAVLKRKAGEAQVRKDYKARIVAEILTNGIQEQYVSPAMQWGNEQEMFARAAYEVLHDAQVDAIGFALHPTIDRAGASPDGLIGKDGMIEIKCPSTTTHIDYLLADTVPEEYHHQMLWEMVCCERRWCDFVSYDPRLPQHLQLFVKRMGRDDDRIALMESAVIQFLSEVDDIIARLPQKPELTDELQITTAEVAAELRSIGIL